ncbi:hypothetical protein O6H91_13G098400 [Diphasiastrum complanatum]|uniref:Uncharacterized protein n=1 Tax=Diphasiastrum complanatum TaxID=34168 RepID=A0ACC2BXS0_DIPCM|nr:hypothetical protein O6H91_13G098400 [Diphasiastrum complanatum]
MFKAAGGPIQQVQESLRRFDADLKQWMRQQSMPVEVALVTATSALQGGVIGALMGTFTADVAASLPQQAQGLNPQAAASLQKAQAFAGGPLLQARNFAVMTGVNAGLTCAMKRLRGGVEDTQTSMIAAFGSGAMFSIVSGMGGPDVATNAVTTGVFFALFQGGLFKLGQRFSKPPENDVNYLLSRSLLHNLGLQRYEKNFKKGLLTDATLPLLNESALRDVNIPPGPRLLILDHIKRTEQQRVIHDSSS